MRILRGQSNLEVSSQGFAIFVVGLILATFLGGAVRTLLSSDRVHQSIAIEIKKKFPRHLFEVQATEVLLSHGIWPALGLRLTGVTFRQDVCGKLSFAVSLPEAVLPLDFWSLVRGRVRLGVVEVNAGQIHLNYRPCEGGEPSVSEAIAAKIPNSNTKPLPVTQLDWRDLRQSLRGITLRDFTVTYERNSTWKLVFKNAYVDIGRTMELTAKVDVHKSLPFGELIHAIDASAVAEGQKLRWDVVHSFKEGQVDWKGEWEMPSNRVVTDLSLRQIPVKDLVGELYQMGLLTREIPLRSAWLSCGLKWDGNLNSLMQIPIQAKDCRLEGSYGRIDLPEAELAPNLSFPLKSMAQVKIQKLQLQPVMESFGVRFLPAVVSRMGVWSGSVSFLSPKEWSLDGNIEGMELVFSNQSVRGKQIISRLGMRARRTLTEIDGAVNSLTMPDGGKFVGGVRFQLSPDAQVGSFMVDVEDISLSPSIQSLLIGGKLGGMQIRGRGELGKGELTKWNGQGRMANLSGNGWNLRQVDLRSQFASGVFQLEVRAEDLDVTAYWKYYPQLRVVLPDLANDQAWRWRDLQAKLQIHRTGGVLTQGLASSSPNGGAQWNVRGSWVRDGDFRGMLRWVGARSRQFTLHGERGALSAQEDLSGGSATRQ